MESGFRRRIGVDRRRVSILRESEGKQALRWYSSHMIRSARMVDWLKRMSAVAAGRLLALVLIGQAGIGAFVIASWQYFAAAPWQFQAVVGISLLALSGIALLLVGLLLHSPTGAMAPVHLRRFKWPIRKVSWDFDGYLGWASGLGQPVVVYMFQPKMKVNWGEGIKPIRAFIECQRTGQKRNLMIQCGSSYMYAEQVDFVPSGNWIQCYAWFSDRVTDTSDPQSGERFLRNFPGFRFVFEYGGGCFERQFPQSELEMILDRAWRYSNPPLRPTARAKT